MAVRVSRIIDNEWSTKTIDVLDTQFTMILVSTGLSAQRDIIGEGAFGSNGTGVNKGLGFLKGVRGLEEDAVEILMM